MVASALTKKNLEVILNGGEEGVISNAMQQQQQRIMKEYADSLVEY
jgi:hypothetical protein